MWIWIVLLVSISIYNTTYGFLPDSLKAKLWIKAFGMVAATVLVLFGVSQIITSYRESSSAYISSDGEIINSRNFTWKIDKTISHDADGDSTQYRIDGMFRECSKVKVTPDKRVRTKVYNGTSGVVVEFFCVPEEVPSFKIRTSP